MWKIPQPLILSVSYNCSIFANALPKPDIRFIIMKQIHWILTILLVIAALPAVAQSNSDDDDLEEIASPKDTSRKKLIKIPPIPKIPKKVLSAADSIAQINYHCARYVFASSAYPIPKGSAYYQNYNVLLNDVQIGLTNQLSVGVGYAFPLLVYIMPKYSLPLKRNHTLAMGDIAGFSVFTGSGNSIWFNTLYGMYTLGSSQNNVSVGLGLMQSSEIDGRVAVTNLSGMYSITPNFYFVGEAWFNNRTSSFKSSYVDWEYDDVKMAYMSKSKETPTELLNRSTLFTSIQFRIIGQKQRTSAWSFGISSYWERGDRLSYDATVPVLDNISGLQSYELQSFVVGPSNKFLFIPSFTYTKKLGR